MQEAVRARVRGRRQAAVRATMGSVFAALLMLSAAPASAAEVDVRQELECLALTIYFEARGEPLDGQIAVGYVVMNRAANPLFPKAICDVVRQGISARRYRCQFTWWCDGRNDTPTDWSAWTKVKAVARRIYWNHSTDPTSGALWYHTEGVAPAWRHALARGPKIGRHIFYWPALANRLTPASLGVPARRWGE